MDLNKLAAGASLGPYVLRARLGRGGFAPVWLADEQYGDTMLRRVALKLFSSGSSGSGSRRAQILEEARALCEVEHPNVVRFYSLYDGDGVVGLVMEHVAGRAVDSMLRDAEQGRLAVSEVLAIGIAVSSALVAVHRVGLVHRDVKPANVVREGDQYKLIDFGIAGAALKKKPTATVIDGIPLDSEPEEEESSHPSRGSSGYVPGSPGYTDPECLTGGASASASSDLYSLGATLYQCLSGEVPARARARLDGKPLYDDDVLTGKLRGPTLHELGIELPEALGTLVEQLLSPAAVDRPRSAEAVAWELERIRREREGKLRPLPPEERGPFRGLGRFEASDRDVLFGRNAEIAITVESLRARGLVALIGGSGSGKSSLARAGVLPAVTEGALGWPKHWDTVVVSPGTSGRSTLVAALTPLLPDVKTLEPEAIAVGLAQRANATSSGTLLLVDQLEELVTVSSEADREYVSRVLVAIGSRSRPGVRALVTAREDLNAALLSLGQLGAILQRGTVIVAPISDNTWSDVIEQALGSYGYWFEEESLRDEVVAELRSKASAMPLVQFALTSLWELRNKAKKSIPRSAYRSIGGLGGALATHADRTIKELDTQRTRDVLLAMTTAKGTRRQVTLAALEKRFPGPETVDLVKKLEAARLVVREGKTGLTLAHEALLTEWGTLRGWIEERRADRNLVEAVERDATEWADASFDPGRLWKGRRLVDVAALLARLPEKPSDTVARFVADASRAARFQRVLFGGVGAAVLGAAVVAAGIYLRQANAAERLKRDVAQQALKAEQYRSEQAAAQQAKALADSEQKLKDANDRLADQAKLAKVMHDKEQETGRADSAEKKQTECLKQEAQIKELHQKLEGAQSENCRAEITRLQVKYDACRSGQ